VQFTEITRAISEVGYTVEGGEGEGGSCADMRRRMTDGSRFEGDFENGFRAGRGTLYGAGFGREQVWVAGEMEPVFVGKRVVDVEVDCFCC